MPYRPEVIAFDVNETLSDMASLGERFTAAGLPSELSKAWFAATLRDGFALAVTGNAAGFADIGAATLRTLLHGRTDLTAPVDEVVSDVLAAFQNLDVHPDIADGLRLLHDAGLRIVTLTNGAASVGQGLLERAGLTDLIEQFLSVQEAGRWKPAPEAYRLAADRTGVETERIALVAVHPWDIDGANRAGLTTGYLDRSGAPYPPIFTAGDVSGADLPELARALLALSG